MFFTEGDLPCWYELSLVSESALKVRIHPEAMDYLQVSLSCLNAGILAEQQKAFDETFIPPRGVVFGIGGILQFFSVNGDWPEVVAVLPIMKREGKEFGNHEHTMALKTRESLSILFNALWLFGYDRKVENEKPQLMVVNGFSSSVGMGQAGLNVSFSPAMVKFLETEKEVLEIPEISTAMYQAGGYMWERGRGSNRDRYYHRTTLYPPNKLHLSVDGNACGLDPSLNDSRGPCYDLSPHNVDSSLQQLSLLAGLCSRHDITRNNKTPPW